MTKTNMHGSVAVGGLNLIRRHAFTDPEEHVQRILLLGLVLVEAGIVTGDYILEVMGLNDVAIVLNPDLR